MTANPPPSAEQALLQAEQAAIEALAQLLHIWYQEAGLHGMLRSLDATLSQCHALLDEFAAQRGGDSHEQRAARRDAERGALSQHLGFMRELCGGIQPAL